MPTPEKVATVAEIKDRLERMEGLVIAEYRGLQVRDITELRRQARDAGVEFKVLKNSLVELAAREADIGGLEDFLSGPNAFAFGYEDPIPVAKVLSEFAKDHKALVIKAGVLEGKVISAQAVEDLAELPPREVLLAQVLRAMQGPVSGLANVLQGTIRKLVYALEAIRQQKEESAGA